MGSIYPYETSKGERRYRIVYRDARHKQTSQRGFKTQREAKTALARVETAIDDGTHIQRSKGMTPLSELAAAWLRTKEVTVKPSSYTALESSWRTHIQPRWGDAALSKIRQGDVQAWVDGLERSPSVKRRAVEVLAGIIDTGVPHLVRENPARNVKLPAKVSAKKHRYLSHQQLWNLAAAAGDYHDHVLVLGYCGIRWGELTALRTENVDSHRQVIHVVHNAVKVGSILIEGTPKGHKQRRVPVPTKVWELIEKRAATRQGPDLLFGREDGTFIIPPTGGSRARTWWNSALRGAGLPYMPIHDLRHTAASLAVKSGAHVKIVQRMLGHKSAAITLDVYADLFEDDLDVLIERLDADINASVVAKSVAGGTVASPQERS